MLQTNAMKNSEGYRMVVYWISLTAALGGLLFGLDQGFIANSLPTIDSVYNLTMQQGEHFAAVLATGGIIGTLFSGFFARYFGRKKSLVIAGFIFSSMSALSAFIPSYEVLYGARFMLGFAVGLASFVVPLYLSETAPTKIRGTMGTMFQFMITIGILLIAFTNYIIIEMFGGESLRLTLMYSVIAAFAVLMFAGAIFLPESPRWLMLKGRQEEARDILKRIYYNEKDVDEAFLEIDNATKNARTINFGIVAQPFFIKILLVGVFLQIFQQLVGINMMIYYAPTIFGYAGITGALAMLTVPLVNVIFTVPAIMLVDKWGRKKLLYIGAMIMFVSLMAAGFAFSIMGDATDPSQIAMLPKVILLVAIVVYIFGFAFSWGPIAWLVCSEIFPLEGREIGMTVTTMLNWTFAGVVMGNALTFMHTFGNASIFFMFAGFCILAIIFLKLFVPETQGVSLEKIEERLRSGTKLNELGN